MPADAGAAPAPGPGGDDAPIVCVHADRCGGCPLITLPYGEQLLLKRGRVVQAVARYPSLEFVSTDAVVGADPRVGYRTRAKLIVAAEAHLGLFARGGGHRVVDIPQCRVLAPALVRVAAALRERLAAGERDGAPLAPFDPAGTGWIRAVDLREAVGDDGACVLVTLVVEGARVTSLDPLRRAADALVRDVPEIAGVAVNLHGGASPQVLGAETLPLAGATSVPDRVGGSTALATFGSFVQAHRGQSARIHAMLARAVGALRPAPRVLDLYGGSGAIALTLAAAGARVRVVESFAPALGRAREAAEAQALALETECADVATALRAAVARGDRFDAAIVNPPRRGMSPEARGDLARVAPALIAYVSCDPETLARDLDHFARLGYATVSLRPIDMIPLTEEVETVALLRRAGVAGPRVLLETDEILVVEKGPHEPTVPEEGYATSLLARTRRLRRAERAVPVSHLDPGTSGLVLFVRDPAQASRWDSVLAAPSTRKIFVAAVRGVTPTKGNVNREIREDGRPYPARTRYRRLGIAAGHSILRVVPAPDRPHQIRRHLASISHPVVGDDRYGHGPTNRHFEEKNGLDRPFLHCIRLEFDDPDTGARQVVEAPLAGDLRAVLERISGPGVLRFLEHKNALGATGPSSLPPAPPEPEQSPLDVDARSPTIRPEPIGDDDDEAG